MTPAYLTRFTEFLHRGLPKGYAGSALALADLNALGDVIEGQTQKINELEAQVAAMKANCARYQHVRSQGIEHEEETGIGMMTVLTYGDDLDKAIDAAIEAQKGKK